MAATEWSITFIKYFVNGLKDQLNYFSHEISFLTKTSSTGFIIWCRITKVSLTCKSVNLKQFKTCK